MPRCPAMTTSGWSRSSGAAAASGSPTSTPARPAGSQTSPGGPRWPACHPSSPLRNHHMTYPAYEAALDEMVETLGALDCTTVSDIEAVARLVQDAGVTI